MLVVPCVKGFLERSDILEIDVSRQVQNKTWPPWLINENYMKQGSWGYDTPFTAPC